MGERLSKIVAAQRPCSRREAEQYIAEGWVRVDGQLVDEPQFRVEEGQRVEVDASARLQPAVSATFLVHKPAGVSMTQARKLLVADKRWTGDTTGVRRAKSHTVSLRELLPLRARASGLVVFSQDAAVIRKLTEEGALVEQELLVDVSGTPAADALARLNAGASHEGKRLPPFRASWQSERRLRIAGKGLDADAVAWQCAQAGLQVEAVRRIRIGRVPMAGLPPGQWRYLGAAERF